MNEATKATPVRHYISFYEPYKESYTIPEIFDLAKKNFNFSTPELSKGKQQNTKYQKIVKKIRRALENEEPIKKGGRKTCYSKQTVQWLLNERLYTYFLTIGEQYNAYIQEQEQVRKFYKEVIENVQHQSSLSDCDIEMAEEIERLKQEKRQEIVIDYICKNLIEIDEAKLEEDLSAAYTADPNVSFEDAPREYIASLNLLDPANYYKIRCSQKEKK